MVMVLSASRPRDVFGTGVFSSPPQRRMSIEICNSYTGAHRRLCLGTFQMDYIGKRLPKNHSLRDEPISLIRQKWCYTRGLFRKNVRVFSVRVRLVGRRELRCSGCRRVPAPPARTGCQRRRGQRRATVCLRTWKCCLSTGSLASSPYRFIQPIQAAARDGPVESQRRSGRRDHWLQRWWVGRPCSPGEYLICLRIVRSSIPMNRLMVMPPAGL